MEWTEEQKKIISHEGTNLLASASAGSGKTAVLTGHILSLIKKGASFDDLLIMTFTEDSAREMKLRIKAAISEERRKDPLNSHLMTEEGNIQNAKISTIHAFLKRFISENFQDLNIDPSFRIGSQEELRLMKSDLLDQLLDEKFSADYEGKGEFLEFCDKFSNNKNDEGIKKIFLSLYEISEGYPWQRDYFESLKKEWGNYKDYLEKYIKESLEAFIKKYDRILTDLQIEHYRASLQKERDALKESLEKNGEELFLSMRFLKRERLSSKKIPEELQYEKEILQNVRKDLWKEIARLQDIFTEENDGYRDIIEEDIRKSSEIISSISIEFLDMFNEAKRRRNILDFSDLEHKSLEILYKYNDGKYVPSETADEYALSLKEILIDEYQDSNYVQEMIINALSSERFGSPNVFQVGDVKQSIYGFRKARPEIFLKKYEDINYPKIELTRNFRSEGYVIDTVNFLFSRIMKKETGGIDYDERAFLVQGKDEKKDFLSVGPDFFPGTELLISENKGLFPDKECEARLISMRIKDLLKEGFREGDICILLRNPSILRETFERVLREEGINVTETEKRGSRTECEIVKSFLRVIDNPLQDIDLVSVMRSPMYGFTDEELAEIVIEQGRIKAPGDMEAFEGSAGAEENSSDSPESEKALIKKLKYFNESINNYRTMSRYLSPSDLICRIYEDGLYDFILSMPDGRNRARNLDRMLSEAAEFSSFSSGSLTEYISYLDRLKTEETERTSFKTSDTDAVRIMSIHSSKGLEFPAVILSGLGRGFIKEKNNKGEIVFDDDLGMAFDYMDTKDRLIVGSVRKKSLLLKKNTEMLGEELRVLYVAMTRAEKKLILTAETTDYERLLSKSHHPYGTDMTDIRGAGAYLDWIMGAFEGKDYEFLETRVYSDSEIKAKSEEKEKYREEMVRMAETTNEESEYSFLKERLNFVYPYEKSLNIPLKHSVSEIKEENLKAAGFEKTGDFQEKQKEKKTFVEMSGAKVGDAYHKAFERYDYSKDLCQLGDILEPEEMKLIRIENFRKFLNTPLSGFFKKAFEEGRLFREQHFMKGFENRELFPESSSSEPVILQGIIDAFIVMDDGVILVDYKSDHTDEKTLKDRYQVQLDLYARVLEGFGMHVKRKVIYSIYLGKEIDL